MKTTMKEYIEKIRKWIKEKLPKGVQKNQSAGNAEKKAENDRTINIMVIIGGVIAIVAISGLIYTVRNYDISDRIYQDAEKKFVVILPEEDDTDNSPSDKSSAQSGDGTESGAEKREWYELALVDLESIQEAYPDVAGWILFENEDISYPVVFSGDNETYLRRTYTGKKAEAGSIFMDGESTPDFSDPHTLIYGHNMKNLTMFGRLKYYKTEKDYYGDHRYFQIFTGEKIYRYEIFAYCDIPADSSVYDVYGGASPENVLELIKELKQKSCQNTDVAVDTNDHIITLSTCTNDSEARMVVSAVRVDEHVR